MSIDELTIEVHKHYLQKPTDKDYFSQIHDAVGDHATRITVLTQWCRQIGQALKSSEETINEKITENGALATDNDSRLKQGLAQLEAQVLSNGAGTDVLRSDAQAALRQAEP